MLSVEFRAVPQNERLAALMAVRDTFEAAGLQDKDLFAADLDVTYLRRHVRKQLPDAPQRAGLSSGGTALYDRVLQECCANVVEIDRMLLCRSTIPVS